MNDLRLHGDPFGDDAVADGLRRLLRYAAGRGVRCALAPVPPGARAGVVGDGALRTVTLGDGVRQWQVETRLGTDECDRILAAITTAVPDTAPVIVFAPAAALADAARLTSFEYPRSIAVIAAREGLSEADLVSRAEAELRWASVVPRPGTLSRAAFQPWLALPLADAAAPCIVHVAYGMFRSGTALVVDALLDGGRRALREAADRAGDDDAQRACARWRSLRLRVVLPDADEAGAAAVAAAFEPFEELDGRVEIVAGAFAPEHVADAVAIVLPQRFGGDAEHRLLLQAMASGRPVCAARFGDNAQLLDGRGVVHAIGGRYVRDDAEHGAHFEPAASAVRAALRTALDDPEPAAIGERARRHVVGGSLADAPPSPPQRVRAIGERRPLVVLEAPLFETSSSAELTIATAQQLAARDNVELRLVACPPFRHDLAWLRRRAPELESLLARADVGTADLWLSSGWPVRARRPDCRRWALRVDWEYGSLPVELTPHVTEDADLVVVHSEHVLHTVAAAGRVASTIACVPHGVDAAMHASAPADEQILAFKGDRPAVLFCGGLVWRKGFDVFVAAALRARAEGREFVLVVKEVGDDHHYGRFGMGALLDKLAATRGAPPVLRLRGDRSRRQLASIYTACDVMVHPYRGEGFGMPVLEARACGLPVVVTAGGAADGMTTGVSAHRVSSQRREIELSGAHVASPWVLEPDVAGVAQALTAVLGDLPAQRDQAVRESQALRQTFSWQRAADAIERFAWDGMRQRVSHERVVDPVLQPLPASPGIASAPQVVSG